MIPTETLAAEGQGALFLIFAGVVVVVLLIGAFWYGSRRSARRRAPARPAEQNPVARGREDSWQTPDGSTSDGEPRA
ncbi:hypothetical protein CP980_32430 [Streptomyces vinaceus]|uniref:LPXTG cell wall anchor domain-containing protein n=1 Tax=Streptomyces vinaceus TaxID=1960 RepID=A0A5J6JNU8_STRVI|nr:DUF6479 family protein [Streptomyces vinaceus]QEV49158.1 hypothetical protein CP980_32430 [Streptomyces vinaceus]GHE64785.1 hypothetical protein GCM10017778_57130 [Streptomyces vinaceus]